MFQTPIKGETDVDNGSAVDSGNSQNLSAVTQFARALNLIELDADSAALHLLLEEVPDGKYSNLYTSVTYGPVADLASIPEALDEARVGSIVAIRRRVPIAEAQTFVTAAASGFARIDNFDIDFFTNEIIEGFRPTSPWHKNLGVGAMSGASSWRRERIGVRKELCGIILSSDTVGDIIDKLSILDRGRWYGIPLKRFPEKLGDIDEIWPSPALIDARRAEDGVRITVDLHLDRLRLDPSRLTLLGTVYKNGMISGTVSEAGAFPKTIVAADCTDLRLFVDGIVMDQTSGCIINTAWASVAISRPLVLQLPRYKSRPEMSISVGAADVVTTQVGAAVLKSHRADAWEIGRVFRERAIADDAEFFYDITANVNAFRDAFVDMGNLAPLQRGGIWTIVDPFALNKEALFSIVAGAMPHRRPKKVKIYTEFKRLEHREPEETVADAGGKASETNRERSRSELYAVAQKVFEATNVPIEVYEAVKLHDRFILLGERVWHVGSSFNTLGQEISAIVEMRDHRRKLQLRNYLQSLNAEPVWTTQ